MSKLRAVGAAAGILFIFALLFTACTAEVPAEDGVSVISTVFPLYDWTRAVAGEERAALLLKNGTDLHSYQPSAEDMLRLMSADLVIYIGGESDAWVEEVLSGKDAAGVKSLRLMDVLGDRLRNEELVEGMEGEEEEESPDEHIWMSPENARLCTDAICEALCECDPENAASYQANAEAYKAKLSALHEAYLDVAKNGVRDTLLVADRFPFRYLTEEYGLNYYAAFAGCSAESNASFETVIFLAQKADALGLSVLLTTESADGRLAGTVAENMETAPKIAALDSMQSVTEEKIAGGYTYLSAMENNLGVLREALQK